jgi:DNA polymerase-3 subunit alpha
MFVHLRAHSCYSFLEGLATPAELVDAAAQRGMPALALTDHGGLTGAIEFFESCRAAGIRSILGLELDIAPPSDLLAEASHTRGNRLTLLAADSTGWANLCRLSSLANASPSNWISNSLPFESLAAHDTGLLCLTGSYRGLAYRLCANPDKSALQHWLQTLKQLFVDRLYIELQHTPGGDNSRTTQLAVAAHRLGVATVATHDIYYIKPEGERLQRMISAIRLNSILSQLPESAAALPGSYFTSAEEMEARFSNYPQAIRSTGEIAERCQFELPLGVPRFPEIDLPPGMTSIQLLHQKAEAGMRQRYPEITPSIQSRLEHELAVIEKAGYASLFLIMEDILGFAYQSGVPISSRGSAASSLVAHCLGITTPDPIRLNLYFERFLNPARATPPDIDTDLCSRRRDTVIHYVYQRYGVDRVAMVCTINRYRRRSALRDVAKAHGMPAAQISAMADELLHRWYGSPSATTTSDDPYAELAIRYASPLHRMIFEDASSLLGLPRHLSIHPGGIVIAPGNMTDLVPTQFAAKGVVITQFDLDSIERLGLVKIDLLGIRGLTVLGDVAEALHSQEPRQTHSTLDILEAIPEQDEKTASLVQQGRTIGCFQIESPGMRSTLKEIQAHSLDDLMVALALYRPGPLTGGLKDTFVRRHLGQEPIEHLHPALANLLADTYGVILYQEQVLRIAHELAGLSLADADLLRRAMSHFDPGKEMQTLREKFILGAHAVSGVPGETALRVWELMAAFAGYGFPKAHAASYAQVAWRSAWCKAHHPGIFMAAVLANWGGYYGQRVYLMEARRLGLQVQPPHVNYARQEFSLSYIEGQPTLFMGLNQVRDLTRRTQARIIRERPYNSFADFLVKVDPRPIEAENLMQCGAFEGMGAIPELMSHLKSGGWRGGQLPLFSFGQNQADWSLEEKAAAQENILGASIVVHPLELYSQQVAASGALSTVEAIQHIGQRLRVAGMRQTWRRAGKSQYMMSLEDLEGMLDVILFEDVYRRYRQELKMPGPFVIEGQVELDISTAEPLLRAERVWCLRKK